MNQNIIKSSRDFNEIPRTIFRHILHGEKWLPALPSVKKWDVIERSHHAQITDWFIEIDGIPLRWKQAEQFDFRNAKVHFKCVEGDFEKLEGEWRILKGDGGMSRVEIGLQFQMGFSIIDKVATQVVGPVFKKNLEILLDELEKRLLAHRYQEHRRAKPKKSRGFGIIAHPYNLHHLYRYLKHFKPDFKVPSQDLFLKLLESVPPYRFFEVPKFKSKSGDETSGFFIMLPVIPDMVAMTPEVVFEKVIEACRIAERHGAGMVILGGFSSIVGERIGKSLGEFVNISITSGNCFTVGLAIQGVEKAARLMRLDMKKAKAVVIGGAGDIGGACADLLCSRVASITLTGRNEERLKAAAAALTQKNGKRVEVNTNNNDAIRDADIIIAAASVSQSVLDYNCLKTGVIVCDVGYPKNISYTECNREDIFIFSGGICSLPTPITMPYDNGLPSPDVLYGCFSEGILLDLERKYENYSIGKGNITAERVDEIMKIAAKHGFDVAPFFWGNRMVHDDEISQITSKSH